ncbi:HPr family phosphocarrier protein [Cellulosimicrobium marinum]|uniref:HPr family phosphocarrier protein n=1 Tax=Cellulosimicrobium marinum TaxID=1638992 RepID=UPI001E3911A6|nr:HPr family phosphocarrier protein [Cellulosimicrobium marinum]MCB7135003.1 HPr family phosphocarrier protein [Cellulosimicrobium marinum]
MDRAVVVAITEGLHARPAALFVKTAAAQPAPVRIARPGGDAVEAASILGVMTLGVSAGDEVVLSTDTDGDDATTALDALASFLERTEVA